MMHMPQCSGCWHFSLCKLPLNQAVHPLNESRVLLPILGRIDSLVPSPIHILPTRVQQLLKVLVIHTCDVSAWVAEGAGPQPHPQSLQMTGEVCRDWGWLEEDLEHVVSEAKLCDGVGIGGVGGHT